MIGPEEAADLNDIPNVPQRGTRLGNWLTREQTKELLAVPDRSNLKGKRDYVIIALLVGCALRRKELASPERLRAFCDMAITENPATDKAMRIKLKMLDDKVPLGEDFKATVKLYSELKGYCETFTNDIKPGTLKLAGDIVQYNRTVKTVYPELIALLENYRKTGAVTPEQLQKLAEEWDGKGNPTPEGNEAKKEFKKCVKATFEMVGAVFEIGAGIATMRPSLGSVGGALKNVKDGIKGAGTSKKVIMLLYLLPINVIKEMTNIAAKDKKALGRGLSSAGPGLFKLLSISSDLIKIIDKNSPTPAALGDMISETTGVPNPVETKAIWDAFEVDAVNQLDAILLDQDASDTIKTAARTYKTSLQKFAILNRAFSEQQSLLAQRTRELGTLVLQKFAVEEKLAILQQLAGNLSNQDEALATLGLQRSARLRELRQAFFSAYCKYHAAYFYQHLAWPAKMPSAVVPRDATEMKQMLLDVDRALTASKPLSRSYRSEEMFFQRSADPELFADLEANGEVRFDIKAANLFSEDGLVRIRQMRARLVGPSNAISIMTELQSSAVLQDRLPNGDTVHFTGDPFFFSFQYKGEVIKYDPTIEGVLPPPFSEWTLKVPDLDLKTVDSIKIEMIGTSVRKPR